MTFQAFSRTSRLSRAFDAIRSGSTVIDAGLASGFESASGFGGASKTATGLSPSKAASGKGMLTVSRFETPLGTMVTGVWNGKLCLLEFADRRALEREIAVANANGQNRMSIIIPCHRVIGADGSLTGYGGGLPRKKALLELEARCK